MTQGVYLLQELRKMKRVPASRHFYTQFLRTLSIFPRTVRRVHERKSQAAWRLSPPHPMRLYALKRIRMADSSGSYLIP